MEKIVIIGRRTGWNFSSLVCCAGQHGSPCDQQWNRRFGKSGENRELLRHGSSCVRQRAFEIGLAQAKALGVRILDAQVLGIGGFDTFQVKTTAGDFETISVILATGSKRKAPSIPGIKEFEGRGVSYCAVCDAFFYRGKDVAVVGNSDFALHEAEELAPMAGFWLPSIPMAKNRNFPESRLLQ